MTGIQVKRVYDPPSFSDGPRFLVDRVWPRGVKKETLKLDAWLNEVAPSQNLRKWFNHDPEKWAGFMQGYKAELEGRPETWEPLLKAAAASTITLLYSARDTNHNNAIALKAFLESKRRSSRSVPKHLTRQGRQRTSRAASR